MVKFGPDLGVYVPVISRSSSDGGLDDTVSNSNPELGIIIFTF